METIKQFLTQIGLSELEKDIFITCIKFPQSSVSSISRILQKPRSTINDALGKMLLDGYLVKQEKSRGGVYTSLGYDGLLALLEVKKQSVSKKMEELKSIKTDFSELSIIDNTFTNIEYYRGPQAIALLYNRVNKSSEMRTIFNIDKSLEHTNYSLLELAGNPLKHKTVTREIVGDTKLGKEYASCFDGNDNLQVKLVTNDIIGGFCADQIITDNSFYFISFAEEIIGIEINNPIFINAQKIIFDQLRERL